MTNLQDFIRVAAEQGGLQIDSLRFNQLTRVKVLGDKGGKRGGAYCLYDDKYPVGLWWNWKTGTKGVWNTYIPRTNEDRKLFKAYLKDAEQKYMELQSLQWVENRKRINALLTASVPIQADDPVSTYLTKRGLVNPDYSLLSSLRYHPNLGYYEEGNCLGHFPAMLATITNHLGEIVSLHRTYLTQEGMKADVPSPKKICSPAGSMKGASVRLAAPQEHQEGGLMLGVTEGIETALAASEYFQVPVWAAISANGMKSFMWPHNIRYLYALGDNDASQVGQNAAMELAKRAAQQGLISRVHIPEKEGADWADVWQEYRGGLYGQ